MLALRRVVLRANDKRALRMSSLDQWKPWVWAVFAFNCLFATVFALLCWETYRQFRNVAKSAAPALVDVKEWCVAKLAASCAWGHPVATDVHALLQDCAV